jgi:hypothetical protein
MFATYLNGRRDLLVVRVGFPIPVATNVSEEIRMAVQSQGYYMRKGNDLRKKASVSSWHGLRWPL